MKRFLNYAIYLILLLALGLILTVIYWEVYPFKTIVFTDNPQRVLNANHQVASGGHLSYEVNFCKYTNIIPSISRSFADGILYTIPETLAVAKPTGCHTQVVDVYVPRALLPGSYTLKTTYRYKINPIRTIDVSTTTESFMVIK